MQSRCCRKFPSLSFPQAPDRARHQSRAGIGRRPATSDHLGSAARCTPSPRARHRRKRSLPRTAQEGAIEVFGSAAGAGANTPPVDVKSLHANIGELTLENDFLEVALGKAGLNAKHLWCAPPRQLGASAQDRKAFCRGSSPMHSYWRAPT